MIDTREFRDALGKFATGVCVVTVTAPDGTPIGMTVNSFASVSLEPPLVLWSIQNNSECREAFSNSDSFVINVLAEDQQALSNQYATRNEHDLKEGQFTVSERGNALLNDALVSFECKVWARYPGGDHEILVGEVVAQQVNANDPLLFFGGKYGALAK